MAKPKNSPYDPLYIMKRDSLSYDDAVKFVEQYKRNKATTLENFIKRYGDVDGKKKYNEWIDKSLGINHRVKDKRSQSKFSYAYYVKYGYSEEVAKQMALDYQYKNSPLHIAYYTSRGFSEEYGRGEIRKIHDTKKGKDSYRGFLTKSGLYTDSEINDILYSAKSNTKKVLGEEKFNKKIEKTRKSFENRGLWIPLNDMTEYQLYRKEVWKHTNNNDLTLLENNEKRARAGVDGGVSLRS